MDVTCDRCSTRYEFDEALVSTRGTTVKCTSCGHQFRVFRPAGSTSLDAWDVRTTDGRELRFGAMRELQAAITSGDVNVDDLLIPGDGGEAKRLGSIEELRSFFSRPTRAQTGQLKRAKIVASQRPRNPSSAPPPATDRDGNPVPSRTGDTLKPPPSMRPDDAPAIAIPRPARLPKTPSLAKTEAGVGPAHQEEDSFDDDHDLNAVSDTLQRVSDVMAEVDQAEDSSPAPRVAESEHPQEDFDDEDLDDEDDEDQRRMPPGFSHPPSEPPEISSMPPLTPSPSAARPSILRRSDPYTDPRFSGYGRGGRRPTFLRWIVGLIALGMVALIGFTLAKKYTSAPAQTASSAKKPNTKVTKLLARGNELLLEGDVEGAKEQFVKASGVSETDPRVSRALADVAIVRADFAWLSVRLVGDNAAERSRTEAELGQATKRADRAVAEASRQLSGADGAIGARLKIDVLRLKGKLADARKLVTKLDTSHADNGRALAVLDLSEESPSYDMVVDRLRKAARGEKKLGRAQAMLVFALASSGDKQQATKELASLRAFAPSLSLLPALQAFVAAAKQVKKKEPSAKTSPTAVGDGSAAAAGATDGVPGDFRAALRKAYSARKSGDLDRAEELYRAALDKNPCNIEALAGLADVAKARGNSSGAAQRYKEMLKGNPDYIPGIIGLADVKWANGERSAALTLYRQVVVNAPGTSYAQHAQARIDQGAGGSAPPATTSAAPKTAPPTTSSAAPSSPPTSQPTATPTSQPTAAPAPTKTSSPKHDLPPGVDVSDLPDLQ